MDFLDGGILNGAIAANVHVTRDDPARLVHVVRPEIAEQALDPVFKLRDQRTLGTPVVGKAEQVERRAAQAAQTRQDFE